MAGARRLDRDRRSRRRSKITKRSRTWSAKRSHYSSWSARATPPAEHRRGQSRSALSKGLALLFAENRRTRSPGRSDRVLRFRFVAGHEDPTGEDYPHGFHGLHRSASLTRQSASPVDDTPNRPRMVPVRPGSAPIASWDAQPLGVEMGQTRFRAFFLQKACSECDQVPFFSSRCLFERSALVGFGVPRCGVVGGPAARISGD